jgi:hypothetical protein
MKVLEILRGKGTKDGITDVMCCDAVLTVVYVCALREYVPHLFNNV